MSIFGKLKKKRDVLVHPWDQYYPKNQRDIEVPDLSIYDYFERSTFSHPDAIALNYFNETMSFSVLLEKIDLCARALVCYGVREGDVVTICMPNTPEAVISFYAVNKIGAIANVIHPLSGEEEIKNSLIETNSVLLITINLSYEKIDHIIDSTHVYKTIIVSAKDSMPKLLGLGYMVLHEWKMNIPKSTEKYMMWSDFVERGKDYEKCVFVPRGKDADAILLHSGGTTGTPKNIVLTNGNVNAILRQAVIVFPELGVGDRLLAILPMFHCFGLVVCVLAPLALGTTSILVPQFDAKRFDRLIRKYSPTALAGVPTLYEALISNPHMLHVDMSSIKYVISGGDSLSVDKNQKVNAFLKEHHCRAHIMQGYGMTETTGPACFGAMGSDKLGSVGIPLPGNQVTILDLQTKEEMESGKIGEICITGPTVMSRYLNKEEETNQLIFAHDDGKRWIHTGDLGYLDENGVLFFVQRLKRMLIVSGYNVYPSHVEEILMKHPSIAQCGVIGIAHPYKIQVPKAYIVLKPGLKPTGEFLAELKKYCKKNMAQYMIPKKFEFRDSLPKTMVGKINYRELEKENSK